MDSFELNKIAGAVLFAVLVAFGLSIFSEILFESHAPESPGYVIAVAEAPEAGEAPAGDAAPQPIGLLMASADPAAGEASLRKCSACHSFGEGEAAKIGPNLYGIVQRPIAATDYAYSEAMVAYAAQAQTWDYGPLSDFLHDPKATVPGTKMAFAGLKNDAERANVIAYLRTLAATPAPLPEAPPPEAAPAPAEGALPAEGTPPPAGAEQPVAGQPPQAAAAPPGQAPRPTVEPLPDVAPSDAAPADAGAVPPAPEAAGESGTGAQSPATPDGSLGAIDAVPADQQGGVPVVPQTEQPEPEPPADQPSGQAAPPPVPAPGAAAPTSPPALAPAVQAPPAVPAPAVPAPAAPRANPPPSSPPPLSPPPAPGSQSAAPAAPEQQVAQSAAPPTAAAAAPPPAAPPAPTPAIPAPAAGAPPASAAGGIVALIAAADPAKGEAFARRCAACHSFEKDGGNKVGPLLWNVVNRPVASVPDFRYSQAMVDFSGGGSKTWTYEELDPYLSNPKTHVPGTNMVFPGIRNEPDRANVIAYLRTLSDAPAPLPGTP